MDTYPIPAQSLEKYYHIDGGGLDRHYKEHLSDYKSWQDKDYAEDWLVFSENIAATIYEHYDEILNFFVNRATNASAESFNAKIKAFRASLRGVVDTKFFLYRLKNIFA